MKKAEKIEKAIKIFEQCHFKRVNTLYENTYIFKHTHFDEKIIFHKGSYVNVTTGKPNREFYLYMEELEAIMLMAKALKIKRLRD